jgi:hypothetical protein
LKKETPTKPHPLKVPLTKGDLGGSHLSQQLRICVLY